MNRTTILLSYIRYLLTAKSLHGTHSPFVYDLAKKVFYDKTHYSPYTSVELVRNRLLNDPGTIYVNDLGTGYSGERKISAITRRAEKKKKYGQLLYRLVAHFKPLNILDIGTSFGLTTAYLASAAPSAKVFTLEGCPKTMSIARSNFTNLQLTNLQLIPGNFDETLTPTVSNLEQLDFVFFDGNHRREPTLRYFEICKLKKHKDSVFIFDDINWSAEMQEAWKKIKQDPDVTVTIDLFSIGIAFFRKEQAKENFTLRF